MSDKPEKVLPFRKKPSAEGAGSAGTTDGAAPKKEVKIEEVFSILFSNDQSLGEHIDKLRRTVFLLMRFLMDECGFSKEKLQKYGEMLTSLEQKGDPNPIATLIGMVSTIPEPMGPEGEGSLDAAEKAPLKSDPPAGAPGEPKTPSYPPGAVFFD